MKHVRDPRRWPDFDRALAMEMASLVGLLLLCLYVVYFSTQSVARIYFLILLCLSLVTKRDHFWFAFFFIIIAQPGWLFADFRIASATRIPLYTIVPGTSFTPMDLFSVLMLAKALSNGKKHYPKLGKPLVYLLAYGLLLVVISVTIYGSDLGALANMLRNTFMYSLLVSFLFLVDDRDKIYRFMHLVFPIIFFILFTQVFFVISGDEFVNVLSPAQRQLAYTETGMLRPVMGGVILVFFSLAFALFLLQHERSRLVRGYLYVVVACSALSVYISATRIWVIMFTLVLLSYAIIVKRSFKGVLPFAAIAGVMLVLATNVTPLRERMIDSWTRVSRVSGVVQGRFYSDTSFDYRYSIRLPHVMDGFKKNWLMGWGFSDAFIQYSDEHVGNFNLLLQAGIIGFIIFLYFWFSYFMMIFRGVTKPGTPRSDKNSLLVLAAAFLAMLVAHFSTYQFFGYTVHESGVYFLSVFIAISELSVRRTKPALVVAKSRPVTRPARLRGPWGRRTVPDEVGPAGWRSPSVRTTSSRGHQ